MIKLLGKFILFVFFFVLLGGIVFFSETIRSVIATQAGISSGQVAGAKTSLEKEVKKDIMQSIESAKNQALQVKVGDIVDGVSRVKKIGQDINGVKEFIMGEIIK